MMLVRRNFALGLAGASLVLLLGRNAVADETDKALAEITKARASLKTMVAKFTQERTIGLLATTVKSEGELILVRPDRLRWELAPPDAVTYWIGPEGLAYATPKGGAKMGKEAAGRFGAVLSDLLIFLGGDLHKLRSRYDLSVKSGEKGMVLSAKPKAEDVKKHVSELRLVMGAEIWKVESVTIEESSGDKSVIAFTKVTRDEPVDPARMQPPKG